jgi:hypothetical protein
LFLAVRPAKRPFFGRGDGVVLPAKSTRLPRIVPIVPTGEFTEKRQKTGQKTEILRNNPHGDSDKNRRFSGIFTNLRVRSHRVGAVR